MLRQTHTHTLSHTVTDGYIYTHSLIQSKTDTNTHSHTVTNTDRYTHTLIY